MSARVALALVVLAIGCGTRVELPEGGTSLAPVAEDPRCVAQQAGTSGVCEEVVGPYWDGKTCWVESGCGCRGADCEARFPSFEDCRQAMAGCTKPALGTRECSRVVRGACAAGCASLSGAVFDPIAKCRREAVIACVTDTLPSVIERCWVDRARNLIVSTPKRLEGPEILGFEPCTAEERNTLDAAPPC